MLELLDYIDQVRWDELPQENSQRSQAHRALGRGLGRITANKVYFVYFDPGKYTDNSRLEAKTYCNAPQSIFADHPNVYFDADGYHHAYAWNDLKVDHERAEAVDDVVFESDESMDGVEVVLAVQRHNFLEEDALLDKSTTALAEDFEVFTPVALSHPANHATLFSTVGTTGSSTYPANSMP